MESELALEHKHLLSLLDAYVRALDFAESDRPVDSEVAAAAALSADSDTPNGPFTHYLLRRHIHRNVKRLRQLYAKRAAVEPDHSQLLDSRLRLDEAIVAAPAPIAPWKILLPMALLLATWVRLVPWFVGGLGGTEQEQADADRVLSTISSVLIGDVDRAVEVGRRITMLALGQVIFSTLLYCSLIATAVVWESFSMKRLLLSVDWQRVTVQGGKLRLDALPRKSATTEGANLKAFSPERSAYGLEVLVFRSFESRPSHEIQLDLLARSLWACTVIALIVLASLESFRTETLSGVLGVLAVAVLLLIVVFYYLGRLLTRHYARTSHTSLELEPFWRSLATSRLFLVGAVVYIVLNSVAVGVDQGVGMALQTTLVLAAIMVAVIWLGRVVARRGQRSHQR